MNSDKNATPLFQIINEAYETLSDERKRWAYDKKLAEEFNNHKGKSNNADNAMKKIISDRKNLNEYYAKVIPFYVSSCRGTNLSGLTFSLFRFFLKIIESERYIYLESNIDNFTLVLDHLLYLLKESIDEVTFSRYLSNAYYSQFMLLIMFLKDEFITYVDYLIKSKHQKQLIDYISRKYLNIDSSIKDCEDESFSYLKKFLLNIIRNYKNKFSDLEFDGTGFNR